MTIGKIVYEGRMIMNVLVISMFTYALEKQKAIVKEKMFADGIEDYSIHAVKALPNEIDGKIQGRQYDYAFIDVFYNNDEVGKIRDHVQGMQHRQIERF